MPSDGASSIGRDPAAVYERTRLAFVTTVGGLSEGELVRRVPAAPEWRVRDVLGHVVGLAADLNAQRFPAADDVGGTAWTARQVDTRKAVALDDLFAEWAREAPTFEDGLRLFGYEHGAHFVADLHAHHQDVRGAVGLSPDDDALTVAIALDHDLGTLDQLLTGAEWGTLEVVLAVDTRVLGGVGPHHARVAGAAFEVLRCFSARRSLGQIRSLSWEGDVDPLLAVLESGFNGGYALPTFDLIE